MRRSVATLVGVMLVLGISLVAFGATITVPDDYPTIQAAIDAAQPGDTVYVKAGVYDEQITIKKSGITLRGEGRDVTAITYSGDGPVVLVLNVSPVTIARLSIRYAGTGRWSGILVVSARAAIVHSTVAGAKLSGIKVQGTDSDVLITDNLIYNTQVGIYIRGGAQGTVCQNELYENGIYGIVVENAGSAPVIEDNVIHDNSQAGIYIHGGGQGTVRHNEIYQNGIHGIGVENAGSAPVIEDNLIHDNTKAGIAIYKGAQGTLPHNEIYGNGVFGVAVEDTGTAPVIEDNMIHDNSQAGIYIYKGAQGTVSGNEIYGNSNSGIEVTDADTNPIIEANKIHDNTQEGIFIYGGAQGTVRHNEIYRNSNSGIEVTDAGTSPVIEANKIHDNTQDGIFIYGGAQGTVHKNEIYESGFHGVEVRDAGTSPKITQNTIALNKYTGVWVFNEAQAKVTDNTIALNTWAGLDVNGYSYGSAGSIIASGNNVWGNGCPEYRGLDVTADDTSTPFSLEDYPALQTKDAYIRLGWAYYRQGLYEKAIAAFEQAGKLEASEDTIDLALGVCYYCLGRDQAAEDHSSKVLDKDPKNVSALISLGWLRFLQWKYDEALELAQQASEEADEGSLGKAIALNNIGYVYFAMGDNEKAVELLLKAVQEASNTGDVLLAVEAHSVLGRAYEALGEMDKAQEHFQLAIDAAETVLSCHNFDRGFMANVGFSYLGLGEVEKGKEYLRRALELSIGDRAGDTIAAMVINKLLGRL